MPGSVLLTLQLATAAFAAPDSLQAVREIEGRRGDPGAYAALARLVDHEDAQVRAAVAVALGRRRDARAIDALSALSRDRELAVREAAAFALGLTPNAAGAVRDRLDHEPTTATWASPATAGDGLRDELLHALGRVGDRSDVPRLVAALAEPWPVGGAAAEALSRLGRRKVDGLGPARPALAAALTRPDPRTVEQAAHALYRIGLEDEAPVVEATIRCARSGPTAPARAWCLRAVWPMLDEHERIAMLDEAMRDGDALVRVAALQALRPNDVPLAAIAGWVDHPDPWLRHAAVAAIGRVGGENAVKLLEGEIDAKLPWRAAEVLAAMTEAGAPADVRVATDASLPPVLRAAAAEAIRDVPTLLGLLRDRAPVVRTAAATAIAEADGVPLADALALLESEDPVVRQAAMEVLRGHADGPIVAPLLAHLRVETDADVLARGLELLAARAERRLADVSRQPALGPVAERAADHPSAQVRVAAGKLRAAVGSPTPEVTPRALTLPSVDDVDHIRSARVFTDRGEIRIALDPATAPIAVANFARLAETDFYDGLVFHRVVPGFVVQGGDPRGDGNGGPDYTVPDEVSPLPYDAGAVGMARAGPDTGGSQWFVTTSPQPHLVGDYTRFGTVTAGMHVVRAIEPGDRIIDVVIERVPAVAEAR